MAKSQKQNIKEWLQTGRAITPIEALQEYGVFRLAPIIHTLRDEGLDIKTEMKYRPDRKRYAKYHLDRNPSKPNNNEA